MSTRNSTLKPFAFLLLLGLMAFGKSNTNTPPCTLTCPNNIIVENDPGVCGAVVDYSIELGDCNSYTLDAGLTSGSLFPIGTTILTATSDEGTSCSFYVFVGDSEAPTAICQNWLIFEVENQVFVEVPASDLDDGSFDNCGSVQLSVSPVVNDTSMIFYNDCDVLGQHNLELWVTDATGNQNFCEISIAIQDNNHIWGDYFSSPVKGLIATEEGEGVEGVQVESDEPWPIQVTTTTTGNYDFDCLPWGLDLTIVPQLDTLPANGVTTWDLVLVRLHILGIQLLDGPYNIIAADADRSNSITTLDMVSIRKVILMIEQSFPDNTSWRFVDKDYEFPDPENPFSEPFPEFIHYELFLGDSNADFVAVKTGDVNGSAE